ncbi:MAG: hypothetical protein R2754_02250 [Microthrixaceae bacterium]
MNGLDEAEGAAGHRHAGGTGPSPFARWGPMFTILAALGVVAGIVLIAEPIDDQQAAGPEEAASRGAEDTTDLELPPGVMTYEQAKADGTIDDFDFGDRCDPDTGTLALPLAPQQNCFAKFTGDNGGATAPGVTEDSIKVVAYLNQPGDPILEFIYGQIGLNPEPGDAEATYANFNEIFANYYEFYGRQVELIPYTATGNISDSVAATADAETIVRDLQPFAVVNGPQLTNAFADTVSANGVLCVGCATEGDDWFVDRDPYQWGVQKTLDQNLVFVAEYLGKRLFGRPAKHAGGPLQDQPRKIGLIAAQTAEGNSDVLDRFEATLKDDFDAEFANVQLYDDPLALSNTGRAMLSQFKSEGITTILFVGDPVAPQTLTRIATEQDYFPEWITSGSTLVENNVFSRTYDQEQWAHAFGPTSLFPRVTGGLGSPVGLHKWYFGDDPPGGAASLLTVPNLQVLFGALQGAGPDLTAERFRDVLFASPILPSSPIAPQVSFGNRGFFPNSDYVALDDMTEISWDPDLVAPDEGGEEGTGAWVFSDGGKRYLPGEWPDDEPHVFESDTGVASFEEFPDTAVKPPDDWAPIAGPRTGKTFGEE